MYDYEFIEIIVSIKIKSDFNQFSFEKIRIMEVKVRDTGIGIPESEIPHLFKMFTTVSQHRNKYNWRGTGIGLTISKKIVEGLGGSISITSQENVGTQVEFTIVSHEISNQEVEESKNEGQPNSFSNFLSMKNSYASEANQLSIHQVHVFRTKMWDLSSRKLNLT